AREAFVEVGLSLEVPPFAVPAQAEPEPPPAPARRRATAPARRPGADRPPPPPRPARKPPIPKAPPAPPAPTTKVCPGCNMRKTLTQFEPGSDFCVDCRM